MTDDDDIYYYCWLNNPMFERIYGRPCPMRARLYGRPCRVFARGTKNSVGLEFIDGLEPHKTVTSRHAIRKTPPKPRTINTERLL